MIVPENGYGASSERVKYSLWSQFYEKFDHQYLLTISIYNAYNPKMFES